MAVCCDLFDAFISNAASINADQELAMKKLVSGILLLLMTLPALADEAIQSAPKIDTDPTALIICAVLFVGMIGGFFFYVVRKGRDDQGKPQD